MNCPLSINRDAPSRCTRLKRGRILRFHAAGLEDTTNEGRLKGRWSSRRDGRGCLYGLVDQLQLRKCPRYCSKSLHTCSPCLCSFCGGRVVRQPAIQDSSQRFGDDRLAEEVVHPCLQTPLSVLRHRVGCHGNDRDARWPTATLLYTRFLISDDPCRFKPIHFRHLTVHKHQGIGNPCQ